MAGTGLLSRRLPCGGDGTELYSCTYYTLEQLLLLRFRTSPAFAVMVFFIICRSGQAPEKQLENESIAGSVMPYLPATACTPKEKTPIGHRYGALLPQGHFIFGCKVRATRKQKAHK